MIYDSLKNLNRYKNIKYISDINEFILKNDVYNLPHGDIEIYGEELFVKVLRYKPSEASNNLFETHQNYMDVQVVLGGIELMQFVQPEFISKTNEFKLVGDFTFYKAYERISDIIVGKNEFTIFFPGEPHKPGCIHANNISEVLKLVFKVRI